MNEPRRFFVVHLQKTAGTTLRNRFRVTLGRDAVYPNNTDGNPLNAVIYLSHLLDRWQERREEIRLVSGHFPLSTVELLDASFVTLSVLRPTVERTLSYLRHQREIYAPERVESLEDIYDDPFRFEGFIHNHMTRMFSISAEEMRVGDGALTSIPMDRTRLERAKEGIAALDAFGLQPRFEEFWGDFARRYDLETAADIVANSTEPMPAPARLVERIQEDNAFDIELYGFAEKLYEERGANSNS